MLGQLPYLASDVFHTVVERDTLATFRGLGLVVKFSVDVYLRTDEDSVVLPHPDHVLCVAAQVQQRLGEGSKRALETLHKKHLHDCGKLPCHICHAAVAPARMFPFVGSVNEIFNGTITVISEPFVGLQLLLFCWGYDCHGVRKQLRQLVVHDVLEVVGSDYLREHQTLRLHVVFVVFLDIGPCTSFQNVAQHTVAQPLRDGIKTPAAFVCRNVVAPVYKQSIFPVDISEEPLYIATFCFLQRAVVVIAFEEVDLILQVVRTVVLWRGREKTDIRIYPGVGADPLNQFIK